MATFLVLALVLTATLISAAYGTGPCGEELAYISVFPGDPLYDNSTVVNNPAFAAVLPAFVALPKTVEDIQRCLACAYQKSVPFTVKSGGHSVIGMSTIEGRENGAFVIYLSQMKSVEILNNFLVKVQAGARWEDVYDVVSETDYLVVGGICPSVGVAGYTLGGGFSFISRLYGLAIDNVHTMTMITVDGAQVVPVNSTTNADLFWALRGGGGGNFGIVVDFTFKLEPSFPSYAYGDMVIRDSNVVEALSAIGSMDLGRDVYLDFSLVPDNELHLAYVNLGYISRDTALKLSVLKKLSWKRDEIRFNSYWKLWKHHTKKVEYPRVENIPITNRATFVKTISPSLARLLVEQVVPENCFHSFAHLGGTIADHAHTYTAYFHRTANFEICSTCSYKDNTEKQESDQYLLDIYSAMEQGGEVEGNYVNNPFLDLSDWQNKYYGFNYDRLLEIQRKWNPLDRGMYHYAQSIGSDYKPPEKRKYQHSEL